MATSPSLLSPVLRLPQVPPIGPPIRLRRRRHRSKNSTEMDEAQTKRMGTRITRICEIEPIPRR
jgi:hypothetical protein